MSRIYVAGHRGMVGAAIARALRARGVPLGDGILNTEDLRAALSAAVDPSISG